MTLTTGTPEKGAPVLSESPRSARGILTTSRLTPLESSLDPEARN